MTEAAQLRAKNGVSTRYGRSEMNVSGLSRNSVLLQAQLRDGKAVDHIDCAQREIDFATRRQD